MIIKWFNHLARDDTSSRQATKKPPHIVVSGQIFADKNTGKFDGGKRTNADKHTIHVMYIVIRSLSMQCISVMGWVG